MVMKIVYGLGCCTILIRSCLMLISYGKLGNEVRKGKLRDFTLSTLLEIAIGVVAIFGFAIARVGLIPIVLLCAGLYAVRKLLPFEQVATQCIYSLLISKHPDQQANLAKAAAMHIF